MSVLPPRPESVDPERARRPAPPEEKPITAAQLKPAEKRRPIQPLTLILVVLGVVIGGFVISTIFTPTSPAVAQTAPDPTAPPGYATATPASYGQATPTPAPGITPTPMAAPTAIPQQSQPGPLQATPAPNYSPFLAAVRVPEMKPVQPHLTVLYANGAAAPSTSTTSTTPTDTTTTTSGGVPTLDQMIAMRKNILAQEAAAQGGTASVGASNTTGYDYGTGTQTYASTTAQATAAPVAPSTFQQPDSTMQSRIVRAAAYELPAGTRIHCLLDGNFNSGTNGLITCHVLVDYRDPRNGALIVPRGSSVLGHSSGILPNQTSLNIAWQWLVYPNLDKRFLQDVDTTDQVGSPGLSGRMDYHTWSYFRSTIIGSIANAAGGIIQSALQRAPSLSVGSGSQQSVPVVQPDVPTVTIGRATPFDLVLEADYTVDAPYGAQQ